MITCTGLEEFIGDRKKYHKIFHVADGMIQEQKESRE